MEINKNIYRIIIIIKIYKNLINNKLFSDINI